MKRNILVIAILLAVAGCNGKKSGSLENKEEITTLSAADSSTGPKIIKTADLKFKVKNAQKTKTEINEQIKNYGGALVESTLESRIDRKENVRYSLDSLLEITSYITEGQVIAKIPSEKLDQFTDAIVGSAEFVDHQSIKFDDQRVSYLVNKAKAQNREAAVSKLDQQKNKTESTLAVKDDYIDQKAANMLLDDRVKFSNITLNFYQDNTIKKTVTGNNNMSSYRPEFFKTLGLNLVNGVSMFKEFILLLANIWLFILLTAVLWYVIRYYRRKDKTAKTQPSE